MFECPDICHLGSLSVQDCEGTPDVIIIGTGSELPMAIEAADKLKADAKVRKTAGDSRW